MIKKIIKIISISTGTILVFTALVFIIPILPIKGNYQVRVVLSGSMEPAIKTGSIVFVLPVSSYKQGDIITFTSKDFKGRKGEIIPVTHRISEVKEGEFGTDFITKGDANDSSDINPARQSNILGKVFFVIPYIGYIVEVAQKPWGFLALILIPAGIIILDQIKIIWSEVKKMKSKNVKLLKTENKEES